MGRSKKCSTEAERIEGYRRVRQKCLREKEWCCERCGGDKKLHISRRMDAFQVQKTSRKFAKNKHTLTNVSALNIFHYSIFQSCSSSINVISMKTTQSLSTYPDIIHFVQIVYCTLSKLYIVGFI